MDDAELKGEAIVLDGGEVDRERELFDGLLLSLGIMGREDWMSHGLSGRYSASSSCMCPVSPSSGSESAPMSEPESDDSCDWDTKTL